MRMMATPAPPEGLLMASLFTKVAAFARSPQGQRMISQASAKAKELANDPKTRAKIDQGAARVRSELAKRRGGGTPPAAGACPVGARAPPPRCPPSCRPSSMRPRRW